MKPRETRRKAYLAAVPLLALAMLASGCSRTIGWGVVLWPPEGSALAYGAVVPVYFQSNITKSYAVGVPGEKAKEELELWRVELHRSSRAARRAAEASAATASLLGITARDGLLLRDKPEVGAEQVFRLKLDQEVKLLAEVEGEAVTTGSQVLEGRWYLALADDGTRGYVFSNQLLLWDVAREPRPAQGAGKQAMDAREADLYDKLWRPDYFRTMVAEGRVDLGSYHPRYGLFADLLRKQVRVERPGFSKFYNFTSIERREDGSFLLVPTGASFAFSASGDLVFTPPEADIPPELAAAALANAPAGRKPAAGSVPISFAFIEQREDPREVMAAEERRRLSLLTDLVRDGEQFVSDTHGSLVITRSGRVTWAGHEAMSPVPIPADAGDTGSVSMDLFLSPALAAEWTGAFTFRFDGGELPAVRFAYRVTETGLELAHIDPSLVRNAVVEAPGGLGTDASFTRYR